MSRIILTDAAGTAKPQNAQMSTKIYFWHNPRTDHILQGAPPQFRSMMPPGYQEIECGHAMDAERWSARLTAQDKRIAEMNDEEREAVEGPMRADLRRELEAGIRKASSSLNASMLRMALRQLDDAEANARTKRESYLHVEAFEHGK